MIVSEYGAQSRGTYQEAGVPELRPPSSTKNAGRSLSAWFTSRSIRRCADSDKAEAEVTYNTPKPEKYKCIRLQALQHLGNVGELVDADGEVIQRLGGVFAMEVASAAEAALFGEDHRIVCRAVDFRADD